jgi:hypothetical protein
MLTRRSTAHEDHECIASFSPGTGPPLPALLFDVIVSVPTDPKPLTLSNWADPGLIGG